MSALRHLHWMYSTIHPPPTPVALFAQTSNNPIMLEEG